MSLPAWLRRCIACQLAAQVDRTASCEERLTYAEQELAFLRTDHGLGSSAAATLEAFSPESARSRADLRAVLKMRVAHLRQRQGQVEDALGVVAAQLKDHAVRHASHSAAAAELAARVASRREEEAAFGSPLTAAEGRADLGALLADGEDRRELLAKQHAEEEAAEALLRLQAPLRARQAELQEELEQLQLDLAAHVDHNSVPQESPAAADLERWSLERQALVAAKVHIRGASTHHLRRAGQRAST